MACEGKTKGKVIYTDKGKTSEIIVPVTPFFVSCNPVGNCGKSGLRTITWTAAAGGSCDNPTGSSFSSFKDEIFFFKAIPGGGTYDGNRYHLYGSCHGTERLIYEGFSVSCGAITITSNTFNADNQTGLIVRDSNNNVLLNVNVSQCDYQIVCDKNCPDGYLECECSTYPGYCCIPCAEIRSEIASATAKLRGINNA